MAQLRLLCDFALMPKSSAAARHRARLATMVITVLVMFGQVVLEIGVPFSNILRLINLVLLPFVLYLAWRFRSQLESNIPFIWHDAHASNCLLTAMFYAIVVFHLFPLLLQGSAEELVESLLLNVAGYFTVYLPLLERAFFPTALISLYGVIASTLVLKAGVQLTTGMWQQVLAQPIFATVTRLVIFKLDWASPLQKILEANPPRRQPSSLPHFEALIDIASSREGRQSLRRVLCVYRLRQDKKEELVAQFIWMYHAMVTWRLPRNALQAIRPQVQKQPE
ncbi:irs-1 [Symbiodinium microadriaticum]|nr:irs-1 [Symbiodinium microadriaticum]